MTYEEETKALKERIAKAKAEREKHEAEAEAKAEVERLRRQAEREENAARDAPHITAAEEQYGPLGEGISIVDTPRGAIVIKRPHHLVYRKFAAKEKPKIREVEEFVTGCVVYPDKARFEEISEEFFGVINACAEAIAILMSNTSKAREGK